MERQIVFYEFFIERMRMSKYSAKREGYYKKYRNIQLCKFTNMKYKILKKKPNVIMYLNL